MATKCSLAHIGRPIFTTLEQVLYDETWVQYVFKRIVQHFPDHTDDERLKTLCFLTDVIDAWLHKGDLYDEYSQIWCHVIDELVQAYAACDLR